MTFGLHKCPAHTRCHWCATSTQHQSSVPQLCLMLSRPSFSPVSGESLLVLAIEAWITSSCLLAFESVLSCLFIYTLTGPEQLLFAFLKRPIVKCVRQSAILYACFNLRSLAGRGNDDFKCILVCCNNFKAAGFGPSETVRHRCLCCIHSSHGFGVWKQRLIRWSTVC